jgi:hypothetical protein
MKRIIFILLVALILLAPGFSLAHCSSSGTTVIFVNGIFGDKQYAEADKELLRDRFLSYTHYTDVDFLLGFNGSHVGRLADLADSMVQSYGVTGLDYDLKNILINLHDDLQTQKIILVGHSQGAFYTNLAYEYLVENGVPKESIAVYNVGSPADRVAGDGSYLLSSTDEVVNKVIKKLDQISFAKKPMASNIDIEIPDDIKPVSNGGHSFNKVYLGLAADRIIKDLDQELSNLKVDGSEPVKEECFAEPTKDWTYKIQQVSYNVTDAMLDKNTYIKIGNQITVATNNLINSISSLGASVISNIGAVVSDGSVWIASLGSSQGKTGDVVLELGNGQSNDNNAPIVPEILPLSTSLSEFTGVGGPNLEPGANMQDILDNIKERIDIINQQIQVLINAQNPTPEQPKEDKKPEEQNNNPGNNGNSGHGGSAVYPRILITEIQTAGATDEKQEFVELYNPNSVNVDLSDWYLQRKTPGGDNWSTYASKNLLNGKKIEAKSYFLISRIGFYADLADVSMGNPITDDNSFELKNPNGEVSDKVGLGLGKDPETLATVNPPAGLSVGRKFDSGVYQDTNNNFEDFELNLPTPRAQNVKYIVTPDTTSPVITLSGLAEVTINVGDQYTDAGATAQDNIDGDITAKIVVVNPVNANLAGDYIITYNVSDLAGNNALEVSRVVHVVAVAVQKILINEVQLAGQTAADEFVELYNPNNVAVDLAGFALKKKNSSGTESNLVSEGSFTGTISALGYFLIAPQANDDGTENYNGLVAPDLRYSGKTYSVASNNTVLLYNNNNVLLDKVGFGLALDFEAQATQNPADNQSMGRKLVAGEYQDTNNNLDDFEINKPTPKAQNEIIPNTDSTVTSTVYTVSQPENGVATISGVTYGTSISDFMANLILATGATTNNSGLTNPVLRGNTLVVTAQDGVTQTTYNIIVDQVKWSQGRIESSTPQGLFVFHTSDFIPNVLNFCTFRTFFYADVFPARDHLMGSGASSCDTAYSVNMSFLTTPGEYDFYLTYCGGQNCSNSDYLDGNYYRLYYDGSVWSALSVDPAKTRLSNNTTLSSDQFIINFNPIYNSQGILTNSTGTISNVYFGTSLAEFEAKLNIAEGATWDDSNLTDPIVTGNTLVVTAQDGVTKTVYSITADPINWGNGTITSYTPEGVFQFFNGNFMPNKTQGCSAYTEFYRDACPGKKNMIAAGISDCGSIYGSSGNYEVNLWNQTTPGDYGLQLTYCDDQQCKVIGDCYQMHYDGTVWSVP